MATSSGRLEIYNMALGFVGTRTIGSANERCPEAVQCELFWDRARRSALRDYPYRFAVRRFRLPAKALPDVYATEWRCAYGIPDEVLKVVRVHGGRTRGGKLPFSIERGDEGELILCDLDNAMADCIVDVEDVTQWDELFVAAMARKLACLIAVPLLKGNTGKLKELVELYQAAVPQADGVDGSEAYERKSRDTWLGSRGWNGGESGVCTGSAPAVYPQAAPAAPVIPQLSPAPAPAPEAKSGDLVSLKDFGAKGDGTADDTTAWTKWQAALQPSADGSSGGVGYIPPGDYLVNGELLKFESGCIGNGIFKDAYNSPTKAQGGTVEDIGGYWRQVSRNPSQQNYLHADIDRVADDDRDNNYERTLIQHQVAYSANDASGRTVCGPIIKTQSIVEYNQPEAGQNYGFGRVIGAYFEGIGKGTYNHSSDSGGTGGFTVLAATAHNRFAGQFGMTAITGQVWDSPESENPGINTYGSAKVCGGYFPVHKLSRFANGGYCIGIETGLSSEADELEDVPYTNNDSHTFDSWICGYHCSAGSNKCPATEGILIDGSASASHAFWNGIVIGASSMRINGQAGYPGTVGLNMASWRSAGNHGDIAIKLGHANRHIWFNTGAKIRSSVTRLLYEGGTTTFSICTDTANADAEPVLQLSKGDVTGNNPVLTPYFVATLDGSNVELAARQGVFTFKTNRNSNAESFVLSDLSFRPGASAAVDLGADAYRWNNVYNSSGAITSSDARLKQDISAFSDEVLDAWASVEWRQFRFRSAAEAKGEDARVHAGLVAQEVEEAFASRGLDASRFGLFCHAAWGDEYEEVKVKVGEAETDDCGRIVKPEQYETERRLVRKAGDEYSIRYAEALCLEVALLRREIARLKQAVNGGASE